MVDRMNEYPSVIDGFIVTKQLLGHGAFAIVVRGQKEGSEKDEDLVAVKVIHKKALNKTAALIEKELKILKELSTLKHENLVSLLACQETTNNVFFVMEYCNGGDLADYMQAKGKLCELVIRIFLKQIAAGVNAIHSKGIVHRDLKPQNILLCLRPCATRSYLVPANEIQLKIADFGFARFLESGNMAGTMCGSPMYMAPEVIMSLQYDAKADLWSVGTIVYQCLTGSAPFEAKSPDALKRFYIENRIIVPKLPRTASPEIDDLVKRLLCKDPKNRASFEEFFKHPFLEGKKMRDKRHSLGLVSQRISLVAPKKGQTPPQPPKTMSYNVDLVKESDPPATLSPCRLSPIKSVLSTSTQTATKSTITDFFHLKPSFETDVACSDDIPMIWNSSESSNTENQQQLVDQLEFVRQLVVHMMKIVSKRAYQYPFSDLCNTMNILEELVLGQCGMRIIDKSLEHARSFFDCGTFNPCHRVLSVLEELKKLNTLLVERCERLLGRYKQVSPQEQSSCDTVDCAEQIIYTHAVHTCIDAVSDERLGRNIKEVALKYAECQIYFHYLSQLTTGQQQTQLLNLKKFVDVKLKELRNQGIISIAD